MKTKYIFSLLMLSCGLGPVRAQTSRTESETETRLLQVSLIPPLSTNDLSDPIINRVSLNLLAGYNYGLSGFELGGLANINRSDVGAVQLAGLTNIVGGKVQGFQMAGLFNVTGGKTGGIQLAGLSNVTGGETTGLQVAGFANVNGGRVAGFQLAGLANITKEKVTGTQLAGILNVSPNAEAPQLAGIANVTSQSVEGLQLAGIFNFAKRISGLQFAGILNCAQTVRGVQIGLINIADTLKGTSIGLINLSKNGLKSFEVSTNDVTDINLSFRSGTTSFYSILTAGIEAKEEKTIWSTGAGFGTQIAPFGDPLYGNIELVAHNLHRTDKLSDKLELLNKLSFLLGYQFTERVSINGGPVLNVYLTRSYDREAKSYGYPIANYTFYDRTFSGTNIKMWIGYQFGLRF